MEIESKRVQRYKYTVFLTTGYARALKLMFIWREQGGTGTGCMFQLTYCVNSVNLEIVYTYTGTASSGYLQQLAFQ